MKEKFEDIELDLEEKTIITVYDTMALMVFGSASLNVYNEKKDADPNSVAVIKEAFLVGTLNEGIVRAIEAVIAEEAFAELKKTDVPAPAK